MYAWFVEEPVKFNRAVPVQIKNGAQKIQTMDSDQWVVYWSKFQEALGADISAPAPAEVAQGQLSILGMGMKEAFQVLEGDASMLLKSYKPDKTAMNTIHVAVTNATTRTAFMVGSFKIRTIHALKTLKALTMLETAGEKHQAPLSARQISRLKSGQITFAWLIEKQQVFQATLTWKNDTRIFETTYGFV